MKQISIGRLMWWSPTRLSCWWMPKLFRGEDENCNPSVAVIVPPFGAFILFWKPGPLRTTPCDECAEFDAPVPNEALAAANRDLLANVRREDGTIVFDTSRGGDILDWQEERAKMSGRFTGDDC